MHDSRRKRRALMRIFRWIVVLVSVVLLWWLTARLISPMYAVRLVEHRKTTPTASLTVQPPPPPEGGAIRILAYNIAHGRGLAKSNWGEPAASTRAKRLIEIGLMLRERNADIVVLNEVDFNANWSGNRNQAEAIAAVAGYPYRVEQRNLDLDLPFFKVKFGNVVLSKHPIVAHQVVPLPALAEWERVAAGRKQSAACTIQLPDGRQVRVMPIHLEARSEPVRDRSADVLIHHLGQDAVPTILAGDFNSTRSDLPRARLLPDGSTAIQKLLDSGLTTAADAQLTPTFPADQPDRVIDWVLVTPGLRVDALQVIDTQISDHCPVEAVVSFETSP